MEMENVLATYPNLTPFGLVPFMNDPANRESRKFLPARIDLIRRMIRVMVKKVGPNSRKFIGSYGGKHVVEHEMDFYITNGEFILAMMLEGYTMKHVVYGPPWNRPTPNATFKAAWIHDPGLADVWRRYPEGRVISKYKKKYADWCEMREAMGKQLAEVIGEARDPTKSVWDQFREIVPNW
jgi:hypothetical protein